jgi:hypothetical protein
MKSIEKMEIKSHGPHQLALRRKSVKVFEGATKVFAIRAPSESGADRGVGAGEAGRTGAVVMRTSYDDSREF